MIQLEIVQFVEVFADEKLCMPYLGSGGGAGPAIRTFDNFFA